MTATLLTIAPTLVPSKIATLTETTLTEGTAPAAFFNSVTDGITNAIGDIALANSVTTPDVPAAPPNNFTFTDLTVKVSNSEPGDLFKGLTPGITDQFIDLTPDNLFIQATAPNVFMQSDTGNDLLIAKEGRNILAGGSGTNTFLGGTGADSFLSDASKANAFAVVLNAGSGDDAVITGVSAKEFTFSAIDDAFGLQFAATPIDPTSTRSAFIELEGFSVADIGKTLTIGVNTDANPNKSFMFIHVN
jgi:Ca2+-binding RTX toxin-like protein